MYHVKEKGIVIKEINVGEADKIVTLLTKNHGKLSGAAKGARRPKSRLLAGTQFLCYSDFVMFKGKDLYSINSCDVIEPFYDLRSDIIKLTYAAHMADILEDVLMEEQPSGRTMQLFLNTLHMLAKSDKPPALISRIFEFRLLTILGYAPAVQHCTRCGADQFESVGFSFSNCGFVCGNCLMQDKTAVPISMGAAKALHYIIHAPLAQLYKFNLSEQVLEELERLSRRYLRERLDKDYRKLDMLKSL